ncbi:hypothetical protein EAY15_13100 [Vibrio anguillarum]|nr:hypothetical protein [Vibrio anguillarum]
MLSSSQKMFEGYLCKLLYSLMSCNSILKISPRLVILNFATELINFKLSLLLHLKDGIYRVMFINLLF